ncbi:MAG TPA: cytochrome c3 family protein [Polyangiaceae bacterium]|nr:cytochrome c3 family protein [Polyangiaceae bacterium]
MIPKRPGLGLCLSLALAALFALADPGLGAAAPAPRLVHRASVTAGLDCSACHTTDGWKQVGTASGASGFDHSKTGFPLTQRHASVPCTACHNSERPITRQCAGCHEDAHGAQLGGDCSSCHSAATWYQTEALARHRQTRLPLTGMHALVECRDCHERPTDRTWTTVAADCFACHEVDYRRPDIHPLHVGVPGDPTQPAFPRDCAQCHRASGWLPVFVDTRVFGGATLGLASARAHERLFPLSHGPHRGADCASCHAVPGQPQLVRCDGCHAHSEKKLLEQHRSVAAYGAACLTCHPGGSVR